MSLRSEQITELRKVRIDSGLCRDCGGFPLAEGKIICAVCSIKRLKYSKGFKNSQIEKGLCSQCGVKNTDIRKGKFLCSVCSEKRIERYRINRKDNKEFIIKYFGGQCLHCNEKDIRCLSLDH